MITATRASSDATLQRPHITTQGIDIFGEHLFGLINLPLGRHFLLDMQVGSVYRSRRVPYTPLVLEERMTKFQTPMTRQWYNYHRLEIGI